MVSISISNIRIGGGGVGIRPPDFYVDSVGGDDGNDGLTPATAFQTLAAAQSAISSFGNGAKTALVTDSEWNEAFVLTPDHLSFVVEGTGAPPIIDGCVPIPGPWTQPDAITYPDVWSAGDLTRPNPDGGGQPSNRIYVAGAAPRRASSLADLQTNGGFYTSSATATTATYYVKSATDPNTDGILREWSKFDNQINGSASTNLAVIGPMEFSRFAGHDGGLFADSGRASKLLLRDGTVHHLVTAMTLMEDIIAIENTSQWASGSIAITNYKSDVTDYAPTVRRVMDINPSGTAWGNAFYMHGSTDDNPGSVVNGSLLAATYEQCYAQDCEAAFIPAAVHHYVRGVYTDLCQGTAGGAQGSSSLTHSLIRRPRKGASSGVFRGNSPYTGSPAVTRVIENCAFYLDATSADLMIFRSAANTGTLAVRNCTIFCEDDAIPWVLNVANAAYSSVIFEYNVVVRIDTGTPIMFTLDTFDRTKWYSDHNLYLGNPGWEIGARYTSGGTLFASSLAQWRALGANFDPNSVFDRDTTRADVLSTYFQGDPADGDFRLKTGLGTFGDGVSLNLAGMQEHWDWNTQRVVSGAATAWPTIPSTLADQRSYIANPGAWDFYP